MVEDGYGAWLGTYSNASVKGDETRVVLVGIVELVLGVAPVNGNQQNADRKETMRRERHRADYHSEQTNEYQ